MRYLLELSKEDIDLSKGEVLSLIKDKHPILLSNFLLVGSSEGEISFLSDRLALTKRIYRVLFLCMEKNLISYIEKYGWGKIYKKDFSLQLNCKLKQSEREIAGIIWNKLKRPKVNLSDPSTSIHIFKLKDRIFCTLLEKELKKDYLPREPHKRPEFHPSSLNPRLARVLINLSSIRKGELVDLFSGSGGILIEAGLMGLKPTGYDIDKIMINRARINLTYYGINHFVLHNKDALDVRRKIKYIVSDLPYGKNTKSKDYSVLYSDFLENLRKILVKRAVIVLPEFKGKKVDYEGIIRRNKLKIIYQFTKYIHNSLSRRIYVLE